MRRPASSTARASATLPVLPGQHAGPRDHGARDVERQPVPAGTRLGLRQQRHLGRPRLPRAIQLRSRRWRRWRSWGRSGQLTCESISYRYRFCNADTQGRANLVRELSTGNLCRQGTGWGYDNRGIWVDRGCRGEFRYGRDSGGRNDAAIAAGILGAFALGAAVSSSQNPQPPRAAASAAPAVSGHAAAVVGHRLVPGVRSGVRRSRAARRRRRRPRLPSQRERCGREPGHACATA